MAIKEGTVEQPPGMQSTVRREQHLAITSSPLILKRTYVNVGGPGGEEVH